jgi:hypothetical protein
VDATLFDIAAERLKRHTGLSEIESRGTLRIALKSAGLEPKSLAVDELRVVFEKLLPGELEKRGVSDAAAICSAVMDDVTDSPAAAEAARSDSPDDVFRRLSNA